LPSIRELLAALNSRPWSRLPTDQFSRIVRRSENMMASATWLPMDTLPDTSLSLVYM